MNISFDKDSFLNKLQSFYNAKTLPEESEYIDFLSKSIKTLENESINYRPLSDLKTCGGLLDFYSYEKCIIVVPDLHGRADFLLKLLNYIFPHKFISHEFLQKESNSEKEFTVLDLLINDEIKIICVGDGVHSEIRGYERWKKAYAEYNKTGNILTPEMHEEMKENISTMQIVMELKNTFVENFHFLKGNHENVLNITDFQNYSFRKFAQEGDMCRMFLQEYYGDLVLHLINEWENLLPICALFKNYAVSHAEPAKKYTKDEIINYKNPASDVIIGFTWTPNDLVEDRTVVSIYNQLTNGCQFSQNASKFLWFGGHRPVPERYLTRQNGKYVQIHNPEKMNVAILKPGTEFNFEEDIVEV